MLPPFSKNYTSPSDQAWREGKSPDAKTLGPNAAIEFKNAFANRVNKNPDYKNFYSNGFGNETVEQAQQKIDIAAQSSTPQFSAPEYNSLAKGFLDRYQEGVSRGLISEEDRVGPDKLSYISSQPATAGSSERSPQTANKFPGDSGTQIG